MAAFTLGMKLMVTFQTGVSGLIWVTCRPGLPLCSHHSVSPG